MTTTVQEAATKLNKLKARLTAIEKERSGVERDFREAAVEAAGGSADASTMVAELRARRVELAEEAEILEAAVAPAEAELDAARKLAREAAEAERIKQAIALFETVREAAVEVDRAMEALASRGTVYLDALTLAAAAMRSLPVNPRFASELYPDPGSAAEGLKHPSVLNSAGAAADLKGVFHHLASYSGGVPLEDAVKGGLRLSNWHVEKAGLA